MMRHICNALTALAIFLGGSALALTPRQREARSPGRDATAPAQSSASTAFSGTFDSTQAPNGSDLLIFTAFSATAGQSGGTGGNDNIAFDVKNGGGSTPGFDIFQFAKNADRSIESSPGLCIFGVNRN
jgi:hypothetical protein